MNIKCFFGFHDTISIWKLGDNKYKIEECQRCGKIIKKEKIPNKTNT